MVEPVAAWTAGQVARHLGIAESTLRAWHRRYGIGPQGEQPGRYRRYAPADVARLRRLLDLIGSGMLASEAARAVRSEPATPDADVTELVAAARALDTERCRLLVDDALVRRGVVDTWEALCRPALRDLDADQRDDPDCVDTEHVLSWATLAALHRVPRPPAAPDAPTVLLACAADEHHTLPLETLSAALAGHRVPVRMLGAATPTAGLVRAVRATRPHTVVLWAQRPETASASAVEALDPYVTRRVVAGPGWSATRTPGVEWITTLPAALALLTSTDVDDLAGRS
jgi:DNA-binding transcriptional MerR regulator